MSILTILIDHGAYMLILIVISTWKLWSPIIVNHAFDKKKWTFKIFQKMW